LEGLLRLAHPFLPFVTEALWQALPGRPAGAMLMTAPYPAGLQSFRDAGAELQMERVIEVTRALRNLKAEWGVPMQRVDASLTGADDLPGHYVEIAARVRLRPAAGEVAPQATTAGVGIRLHLEGSVDVAAERARAASELAALEKELASVRGKLGNEQFLSRAPAEVVEKQRRIEAELVEREVRLRERLAALAG
jgi:valyl-tRNA synthetase